VRGVLASGAERQGFGPPTCTKEVTARQRISSLLPFPQPLPLSERREGEPEFPFPQPLPLSERRKGGSELPFRPDLSTYGGGSFQMP
jgi:hypothetical protein